VVRVWLVEGHGGTERVARLAWEWWERRCKSQNAVLTVGDVWGMCREVDRVAGANRGACTGQHR
jgi:hypothetical protein